MAVCPVPRELLVAIAVGPRNAWISGLLRRALPWHGTKAHLALGTPEPDLAVERDRIPTVGVAHRHVGDAEVVALRQQDR